MAHVSSQEVIKTWTMSLCVWVGGCLLAWVVCGWCVGGVWVVRGWCVGGVCVCVNLCLSNFKINYFLN